MHLPKRRSKKTIFLPPSQARLVPFAAYLRIDQGKTTLKDNLIEFNEELVVSRALQDVQIRIRTVPKVVNLVSCGIIGANDGMCP
jgi:hypothetical protein